MKIPRDPLESPVLEGGPGMVDSRAKYIRAVERGQIQRFEGETLLQSKEAWFRWAKFVLGYRSELEAAGIKCWYIDYNQPTIDFTPGKNRISLFADYRSRQYEADMLARYGVDTTYLAAVGLGEVLKGRQDIQPPYVLKDINANKGRGKLLVEDDKKHLKVLDLLRSRRQAEAAKLIAEPYIETPSDFNATYRITATPGGQIHGAAIIRSASRTGSKRADWEDAGRLLAPLVEKGSPYFIDSPRVVSNRDGDKAYVAMGFPGRWYELTVNSDENSQVLLDHGIDPIDPVIPETVRRAGVRIARVLGPSIGMHIGIDLIQSKEGTLHLLEANPDPQYTSIYETMDPAHEQQILSSGVNADDTMRFMAFKATVKDLLNGVFAETDIAA